MKYENIKNYSNKNFIRTLEAKKNICNVFLKDIRTAYNSKHKKGGRKSKLCIEDILILFFLYYRSYNTYFDLANSFGIDEANVYTWINWREIIISRNYQYLFNELLQNKNITKNDLLIVDATESPIQRPSNSKNQKKFYSGKKKKHTYKTQILLDDKINLIRGVSFAPGSKHDFKLFKENNVNIYQDQNIIADNGYQGIFKLFLNSLTPKKKSMYHPLTIDEKELNKLISNIRIKVEHINFGLKVFKIVSERFRNRLKTFKTKMLIICMIYNFKIYYKL